LVYIIVSYLSKFTDGAWHDKVGVAGHQLRSDVKMAFIYLQAVSYYRERLEHTDQSVRIGACLAMGKLKVSINLDYYVTVTINYHLHNAQAFEAIQPLRYLMRVDFDPVKEAAKQALTDLGT